MAKASSSDMEGVPSFEFNPKNDGQVEIQLSSPIADLENMLTESFAGQTKKMDEIYQEHNVGTLYISKNYKEALRRLEQKKLISVDPPADKRQNRDGKVTFGDNVLVTFASRST